MLKTFTSFGLIDLVIFIDSNFKKKYLLAQNLLSHWPCPRKSSYTIKDYLTDHNKMISCGTVSSVMQMFTAATIEDPMQKEIAEPIYFELL